MIRKQTTKHFSSGLVLMSIMEKRFSPLLLVFAEILILAFACSAQRIEANLKIESISPPVLRVEGKILQPDAGRNWAFLRSIAGIEGLAERISDFNLIGNDNNVVPVKKLITGEYLAAAPAVNFSYRVNLKSLKNISAMAHASWLNGEQGFLMLDDVLPQFTAADNRPVSAKINFELPDNWKVAGNEKTTRQNSFDVADIEKAVFLLGKAWREKESGTEKNKSKFIISGDWLFTDEEVIQTTNEILKEYQQTFGELPNESRQIFLVKFPPEVTIGNWEAETRGSNVVILSSDMPFKTQSIQRLHEQLRHELFHLWMPNNLALTGNYDWFYEGFALYQSLRTGLLLNRIRFEDFLDTLGRAFDLDNMQSRKISLIEASKSRWNGANTQIYARGMLIAFLCDVSLLRESKGKLSISDVLREIYQKHKKPNPPQEGNAAILAIFENHAELRTIVERYIKGVEQINWQTDLESAGIESNGENFPIKLAVKAKLTGRQKDLLEKLGYNNWRKISKN